MTDEVRARALQDERLIRRTLYHCARALDYGENPEQFLDCFTEDGSWWSSRSGRWNDTPEVRNEGRAQLERWFVESNATRGRAGDFTHHLVWNTLIDLDGDRAIAESYTATIGETRHGPQVRSMGRYLDVLVRCRDGAWRLQERRYMCESVVP